MKFCRVQYYGLFNPLCWQLWSLFGHTCPKTRTLIVWRQVPHLS